MAILEPCPDVIGEVAVNIGKAFEIAFRMRRRRPAIKLRDITKIAVRRSIDFHWLVEPLQQKSIRFPLMPLQAAELTVNPKVQIVLLTYGNLRAMEHAFGA